MTHVIAKRMKTTGKILVAVLATAFVLAGCDKNPATLWLLDKSGAATQLKHFLAAQEALARSLAKQDGNQLPSSFDAFYHAAETGDWPDATILFGQMSKRLDSDPSLRGSWWPATLDAYGMFTAFPPGDKYAIAFGQDIIQSIPAGAIYFGGTDPARFVVNALMDSHAGGKPFFALSQNPLGDATYLRYLRAMYGGKIHTLTDEDLHTSLQAYTVDAQRRLAHDQHFPNEPGQLKPGEEVRLDANGQIQMSGQMNVIGVRELLTKAIFDQNPDREFFIAEGFPLDWMYPYLEPHGLIMKINRRQSPELSAEIVRRDRDFWTNYVAPRIGGWLKPDTTIEAVAAFAEKIHVKRDLNGFSGDPQFVQCEYWCNNYSQLRSSIGGLYEWRAQHTIDAGEKKRMADAADFAFRQAWALCPYSLETLSRYVGFLLSQHRRADALLVVETAAKLPQLQDANAGLLRDWITNLKESEKGEMSPTRLTQKLKMRSIPPPLDADAGCACPSTQPHRVGVGCPSLAKTPEGLRPVPLAGRPARLSCRRRGVGELCFSYPCW